MRERHTAVLARFDALAEPRFIPVATRVQLEGGIYAHPRLSGSRREAVDLLLRRLPRVEFSEVMALAYGRIVARAGFSRRRIIDRMIAASALVRGLTLITINGGDFADVADLSVEEWTP